MAFSDPASLAAIATALPAAVHVREQLGMNCCHEDGRSLVDAWYKKGLDQSAVSAQIERSAGTTLHGSAGNTAPFTEMIVHTPATHHAFLRRELPSVSERLASAAPVDGEREQGKR